MNATIEDPFEFITAAIYENQLNFERIEKALMLDEYYYLLENSKEMVYESNIITSFFGKILQAIKSIWGKIKDFFKSIFSKEKQVTEANKKAAEKVKKNPQLANHGDKIRGSNSDGNWYHYKLSALDIAESAGVFMLTIMNRLDTVAGNLDHCNIEKDFSSGDFSFISDLYKYSASNFCELYDLRYDYADAFKNRKPNDMTITEYMDQECRSKASDPSVDAEELNNSEKVFDKLKKLYVLSDKACKNIYNTVDGMKKQFQQLTPDAIRSKFNDSARDRSQRVGMTEDQVIDTIINKTPSMLRIVCQGCQTAISQVAEADKAAIKLINDKYAQTRKVINLQDKNQTA